jgi:hypothetical protein
MIMKRKNIFLVQGIAWLCITLGACSGTEEELAIIGKADEININTRAELIEHTINVEEVGTLGSLIEAGDYANVQKLIVTGNIAYEDVNYVDVNMATVEVLDLSEATYESDSISGSFLSRFTNIREISLPGNITSINGYSKWDSYNGETLLYYPFYKCSSLTSIILPEGMTSIGDYAFYYCSSLTSITLPEGVTSIGDYAFNYCRSLTSITLPEGVTSIGDYAFYCCSSLTSVTLSEGMNSIGEYAFCSCSSLTSITIPEKITSIGFCVFAGCSSLTSIILPEGMTSIGDNAFSSCSSLTSIILPEGITSIGDYAFFYCSSLTSIILPEGITSIGDYAFFYCSSLTSIHIPKGVTSIGDYAFYKCSALNSIDIPEGVTSIGEWTFSKCSSLTCIDIPESVTSIGGGAFVDCSSLRICKWNTSISVSDVISLLNRLIIYGTEEVSSEENDNNIISAKKVTYTKDFSRNGIFSSDSNIDDRWHAISLPFKPTDITHEEKGIIAPFDSNIEGAKNFWLRELTPDGYQDVSEMESGHAYIIAMPSSSNYSYGFRLDGTVTFSAENVTINWETTVSEGPTYSMYPTYETVKKSMDIYAMNSEYWVDGYDYGRVWVRGAMDVNPFEAYVKLNDGAATMRSVLPMADGKRTAVRGSSSSNDASSRGAYGHQKPRKEDM